MNLPKTAASSSPSAQFAVLEHHDSHNAFRTDLPVALDNVLMKYEAGTAAFKTQTTYETVAAAQRCLVFHFYLPHNCIDSLIVHLYEGESASMQNLCLVCSM